MDVRLRDLLAEQAGVVSRRQLTRLELKPSEVRRLIRRRDLTPIRRGVFVDHTGEPSWTQQAWAAVLSVAPAALWGPSALQAYGGVPSARDGEVVHVAIGHHRRVAPPPGVVIHRELGLDEQVRWNLGPPRQCPEEAVLDAAAMPRLRVVDRVAVLTDVVGARRLTTAQRVLAALKRRARYPHRAWWEDLLADLAVGTCSVLEHGYLVRVERPHGLPAGRRQERAVLSDRAIYRDVDYGSLVVELDGRTHHSGARARDRDLERDLDTALTGVPTVRLGYGQVFDRPCEVAGKVAALLGIDVRTCSPDCVAV